MRASDNTIVKIFGPGSVTTPTATTTVSGISELATNSETTTGTATNRVVTPAGLNAVTVAERTTSNTNYVAKAGSTLTGVLTMPNGSNSAPAINFGDSDSGIFGGTNTVSLAAGGTTRLTADTGVSVVGTLAVTGAITSTSDLTIADKIIHSGDTNTAIRFPAADTVSVETGGNEAFRVDSSQRLLVGTSTARSPQGITPSLQIEGTDVHSSSISITRNSTDNASAALIFNKSRGATVGSDVVVQDNDVLGIVYFTANDGTDSDNSAATITAEVDGTPGSNDTPGRLKFSTTADGAANPTERMRIDSSGVIEAKTRSAEVRRMILAGSPSNSAFNIEAHDGETGSSAGDVQGKLGLFYNDGSTLNNTANLSFIRGSGAPDGAIAFVTNQTERMRIDSAGLVKLPDNGKFVAGTGEDLQIYHDGTHSYIYSDNGELKNRAAIWKVVNAANSEIQIKATENAAVELYYDHSKKLETDTNGITVTGRVVASGTSNIGFAGLDNVKLSLGTSDDLQIYHTSSHSYLLNSTGNLYITAKSDEDGIIVRPDGAVELYHDNSKKFETTSYGNLSAAQVRVASSNASTVAFSVGDVGTGFYNTGSNAIGYSANGTQRWNINSAGDLRLNDNVKLRFGGDNDMNIYHLQGANSYITNTANNLYIQSENGVHIGSIDSNGSNVETSGKFIRNGAVELYYDNSKKFETTSDGVDISNIVQIGTSNDQGELRIGHDGTSYRARLVSNSSNSLEIDADGPERIQMHGGVIYMRPLNSEKSAAFVANGAAELYYDDSKKFETTSTGINIPGSVPTITLSDTDGNTPYSRITAGGGDLVFEADQGDEEGNTLMLFRVDDSEKMRINSNGRVMINTTTDTFDGVTGNLNIANTNFNNHTVINLSRNTASDRPQIRFSNPNGNVGSITTHNSATSYNTSSDYRLKENVTAISDGITRLKTLKPYRFNFKADATTTVDGFFAHEVTAVPEAITGTKDEVDENNNPVYQGIDQSKLVPLLVAAVQELIGRVEKLEGA
jgi:hypothetical protein